MHSFVQAQESNPLSIQSYTEEDKALLEEFKVLWDSAETLWDQNVNADAFHGYVSADYQAIFDSLLRLKGRVFSVLEWGSGLGVATIMADLMGFNAFGIEVEEGLIEFSEELKEAHQSDALFVRGSFIPDDFEWSLRDGDEIVRTIVDVPAAYDELDMEIRDFDLIYSYPWPDELTLYHHVLKEYGNPESFFMSYDAREGLFFNKLAEL